MHRCALRSYVHGRRGDRRTVAGLIRDFPGRDLRSAEPGRRSSRRAKIPARYATGMFVLPSGRLEAGDRARRLPSATSTAGVTARFTTRTSASISSARIDSLRVQRSWSARGSGCGTVARTPGWHAAQRRPNRLGSRCRTLVSIGLEEERRDSAAKGTMRVTPIAPRHPLSGPIECAGCERNAR